MSIIKDGKRYFTGEEAAQKSGFTFRTFQQYAKRHGRGRLLHEKVYTEADLDFIMSLPRRRKRWTKQNHG